MNVGLAGQRELEYRMMVPPDIPEGMAQEIYQQTQPAFSQVGT